MQGLPCLELLQVCISSRKRIPRDAAQYVTVENARCIIDHQALFDDAGMQSTIEQFHCAIGVLPPRAFVGERSNIASRLCFFLVSMKSRGHHPIDTGAFRAFSPTSSPRNYPRMMLGSTSCVR